MLRVETARHQVVIAGQVIDGQTEKALPTAQVQLIDAPEVFVDPLVMRARQVWLGSPALAVPGPTSQAELDAALEILNDPSARAAARLNAARSVLINPLAKPDDNLAAARAIQDLPLARPEDQISAARIVLNHEGAGRGTRLRAALAVVDLLETRSARPASPPHRAAKTSDGFFFFMDLPAGNYQLRAWLPGAAGRYYHIDAEVTVSYDGEGNVVEIAQAEMRLPPTTLTGKIVDEDTGEAIPMAEVRVLGSGEFTFSAGGEDDQDPRRGTYRLIALEPGTRQIRASARGYSAVTKTVDLLQGKIEDEEFQLKR